MKEKEVTLYEKDGQLYAVDKKGDVFHVVVGKNAFTGKETYFLHK